MTDTQKTLKTLIKSLPHDLQYMILDEVKLSKQKQAVIDELDKTIKITKYNTDFNLSSYTNRYDGGEEENEYRDSTISFVSILKQGCMGNYSPCPWVRCKQVSGEIIKLNYGNYQSSKTCFSYKGSILKNDIIITRGKYIGRKLNKSATDYIDIYESPRKSQLYRTRNCFSLNDNGNIEYGGVYEFNVVIDVDFDDEGLIYETSTIEFDESIDEEYEALNMLLGNIN